MLRDSIWVVGLLFFCIILIMVVGYYYQGSYKQNAIVLGITETLRTSAIANADNISRLNKGELFICKEDFEKDFKERITKNSNVNFSDNAAYEFKYLDNHNGSTKAIKVFVKDSDVKYQATAIVDISTSND